MQPLNDLNNMYFFAAVVDAGGFSAAARDLGLRASKLSRRIWALEQMDTPGAADRMAGTQPPASESGQRLALITDVLRGTAHPPAYARHLDNC
jgi:Bacterial regulatory helix-turn-helix protein, lysR family